MADVHVRGLLDLQKFLDTLPAKLEANVMRGALRAGANVIRTQAKANVPVKSGLLRAGLKITTRSRRGVVTASVKAGGKHGFIAPWIEFGTAAHKIASKKGWLSFGGIFAKSVDHPGAKPHPFMRPALDSEANRAIVAAAEYMKKRLATKHGLDTADIEIEVES